MKHKSEKPSALKDPKGPITFNLSAKQIKALAGLSGGCRTILSGQVVDGALVIDTVTLGAPIGDSAYTAVNAPFKPASSELAGTQV